MRFDDQPDALAGSQFQGTRGARRDVNQKQGSGIHSTNDCGAVGLQRCNGSFQNVAGAQTFRLARSQENISGANSNVDAVANRGIRKWHLEFGF